MSIDTPGTAGSSLSIHQIEPLRSIEVPVTFFVFGDTPGRPET